MSWRSPKIPTDRRPGRSRTAHGRICRQTPADRIVLGGIQRHRNYQPTRPPSQACFISRSPFFWDSRQRPVRRNRLVQTSQQPDYRTVFISHTSSSGPGTRVWCRKNLLHIGFVDPAAALSLMSTQRSTLSRGPEHREEGEHRDRRVHPAGPSSSEGNRGVFEIRTREEDFTLEPSPRGVRTHIMILGNTTLPVVDRLGRVRFGERFLHQLRRRVDDLFGSRAGWVLMCRAYGPLLGIASIRATSSKRRLAKVVRS